MKFLGVSLAIAVMAYSHVDPFAIIMVSLFGFIFAAISR